MNKKISDLWIIILCALIFFPLQAHATDLNDITFKVDRFLLSGEVPGKRQEIDEILTAVQGKQYNLKELQQVAKRVETVIRQQGYAFYRVTVPPQTLSEGQITLNIIAFSLGKVNIKGNEYFDDNNIRRSLPALSEDNPLNTHALAESLKVANYNASKQVKLTFKQSEVADKVEAEIVVAEERPYHASLIFNNAGTKDTGYFRLTAALQHNNLWNLDHTFNASYTTSPGHADEVMQYGVSYNMPIYFLKGWLTGYYAKSDVDTGVVAGGFDISGSGEMYGFHYLQYLPKFKRYEHWFNIGIDNRFFDNNIIFEQQNIGTDVRSVPFSMQYKGEIPWKNMQFNFNIEWAKNIDVGSHNSNLSYAISRVGAKKDWDLIRYGVTATTNYHQWLFRLIFNGQYTDDTLISGEQIGLGGTYSVRGYKERESSADSGDVLHLEVHTPSWKNINLLTFFDYGHGSQRSTFPGEPKDWDIASLGIGARWQWRKYIFANIDLAFALKDAPELQSNPTNAGDNRIHGSIVLRY